MVGEKRFSRANYKYIGKKVKLDKPVYVIKNGKKIKFEYTTILGKYTNNLNQE
jgi:hypothetical protein